MINHLISSILNCEFKKWADNSWKRNMHRPNCNTQTFSSFITRFKLVFAFFFFIHWPITYLVFSANQPLPSKWWYTLAWKAGIVSFIYSPWAFMPALLLSEQWLIILAKYQRFFSLICFNFAYFIVDAILYLVLVKLILH